MIVTNDAMVLIRIIYLKTELELTRVYSHVTDLQGLPFATRPQSSMVPLCFQTMLKFLNKLDILFTFFFDELQRNHSFSTFTKFSKN